MQKYYLLFVMHLDNYFFEVVLDYFALATNHDIAMGCAVEMEKNAYKLIKAVYEDGKISIRIVENKYFNSAKMTNFSYYDEDLGDSITLVCDDGFELYPVDNPICYVAKNYQDFCDALFKKFGEKKCVFECLSYGMMLEKEFDNLSRRKQRIKN